MMCPRIYQLSGMSKVLVITSYRNWVSSIPLRYRKVLWLVITPKFTRKL